MDYGTDPHQQHLRLRLRSYMIIHEEKASTKWFLCAIIFTNPIQRVISDSRGFYYFGSIISYYKRFTVLEFASIATTMKGGASWWASIRVVHMLTKNMTSHVLLVVETEGSTHAPGRSGQKKKASLLSSTSSQQASPLFRHWLHPTKANPTCTLYSHVLAFPLKPVSLSISLGCLLLHILNQYHLAFTSPSITSTTNTATDSYAFDTRSQRNINSSCIPATLIVQK
jgi:hypothetical protein